MENALDMTLEEAVKSRRSVRGFLKTEVPVEVIRKALELAQWAPSNSNIQPWWVFIASGKTRDTIQKKLYDLASQGAASHPDFSYTKRFEAPYRQRQVDCASELYTQMGIARHDKPGRMKALLRNFKFFDAPHMAFICMEKKFPQAVAVDVGIYAQTLMLAFAALGVSTCAMGAMREYPQVAKTAFGIKDNLGILFGMAFGYEDPSVPANRARMTRAPIDECVTFLS